VTDLGVLGERTVYVIVTWSRPTEERGARQSAARISPCILR